MSAAKSFTDIIRCAPSGRFASILRPYTVQDVLRFRGSVEIVYSLANVAANKLWHLLHTENYVPALGALTGNQAMQMARAGLKSIYLSGWQVAADNNLSGMMYPDQSLYPSNSGPELCRRINRTLHRADQIEHLEGKTTCDWLLPIVADAEAGFGGPLNCYEIMKNYIEAGAAAVHFEDQLASEKKCGHLGGKVLIPTTAHIRNLSAARLAADVCGTPTILICRTDAESAKLITASSERDEPFVDKSKGRTVEGFYHLKENSGLDHCIYRSLAYAPYADVLWMETSTPNLEQAKYFAESIRRHCPDKLLAYNCSPSFNWQAKLSKATVENFQSELGKMGYKYQFVTLAGFHCLNYGMFKLAKDYKTRAMLAYSEFQQKEMAEESQGYTAIHHQREVGVQYYDAISVAISKGESSTTGLTDSTETGQFFATKRGYHTSPVTEANSADRLRLTLPTSDSLILNDQSLQFLKELQENFNARRLNLLSARQDRQRDLDSGKKPGFLFSTSDIRRSSWTVGSAPADLEDRRVEITGPLDRKMIINALNSGAKTFMADFEDSNSPTWKNVIEGQRNLYDAVRGTISHSDAKSGKQYRLNDNPAVLMVRPRGWHLEERHVHLEGQPMSASLFDFGLYAFHNAAELAKRGSGAYFYLPKMESHLEAKLWNDVFKYTEERLNLQKGTLRCTALVEHVLATFEIEEILYHLMDYIVGLNCGRWDYIFSYIKTFRSHPNYLLPDRESITMAVPFMDTYANYVIKICHKRAAHAIGGMSAFIPVKSDPVLNEKAFAQVIEDKEREVANGHDGTWVAHPGLVPIAMDIFNKRMPNANQLSKQLLDFNPAAEQFIKVPEGVRTEAGLSRNVSVALGYLEAWLRGNGCVPLYNLMEDAATAEISRSQLWQWVRHNGRLQDGRIINLKLVEETIASEANIWKSRGMNTASLNEAVDLLRDYVAAEELPDFLTVKAYEKLIDKGL